MNRTTTTTTTTLPVHITPHHLRLSPALRDFAHHKLAKVPRFSSDALRMDLVLRRHGGADEDGRFSASARVALPGRDIHATAVHADLYTAIVKLVGRLARRSRKRKTLRARGSRKRRRSAHYHRPAMPRDDFADYSAGPDIAESFTPEPAAASIHRGLTLENTSRETVGLVERSSSLNPAHGIARRHVEQLAARSRARKAGNRDRPPEMFHSRDSSLTRLDHSPTQGETPVEKTTTRKRSTDGSSHWPTHVLLAIDRTKSAGAVARAGAALAGKTGARLTFLHVLEPVTHERDIVSYWADFPQQRRHHAMARLRSWSRHHANAGNAWCRVTEGRPWEEIVRFSTETPVDLIVMGRSGESQWFGQMTARTVERVAQNSACPVLIVGQDQQLAPFEPRRVLLTTDFSADSLEAFPWADRIARRYGAQILLANVQDPMGLPGTSAYAYFHQEIDALRKQADAKLEAWRHAHLAADLPVETRVMEGMAAPALRRLVEASQTDLILMSTHGTKGWVRKWLGGTTEGVLRNVTCSMLVVPPRQATERVARS